MFQDVERLQLAALLHDIGKFRQRRAARLVGSHQQHGSEFVTKDFGGFFHPCGDDLGDAILNHHNPRGQTKEIEKQVTLADGLSATEREDEEREREQSNYAALVSIMSRLQIPDEPRPPELRYDLNRLELDREHIFPTEGGAADPSRYEVLWGQFTEELQRLSGERGYQSADYQTLVALLHKYTIRIPSATPWERGTKQTVPDVSLYDHLRTTAAIATCVHREVLPDHLDGYRHRFAEQPLCTLLKGDISGIQTFLYRIKSKGASQELRGRSFYLQLLTEAIALWILRRFDLPITNLLLASGGHFYLLLPYRESREKIDALRAEIAEKLWQGHREELSIVLAGVHVTAGDFEAFSERWELVSKGIERRKQTKWRELSKERMFDLLFTPGNEGETADYGFPELGRKLRDVKHLVAFEIPEQPISDKPDWRGVIGGFGLDIHLVDSPEDRPSAPAEGTRAIVYRLDSTDFLSDEALGNFRWDNLPVSYDFRLLPQVIPRGPGGDVADFDQLADASEGAKWLGVLRMDVDNLGKLFRGGLGKTATISRMSTLSESMRLFFEGYLPQLCRGYNANHRADILELIYAGGDDLFLVGGWSALPRIAHQIREEFRAFVGGEHVTLSGGIAVEHKKYPLYQLADDAGNALDSGAKALRSEKDALSFLQKPMAWEEFDRVDGWHQRLLEAVSGEKPLPSGFLTRLSELHHLYENGKAGQRKWAWRLVYHLGRAKQMYRGHTDLIDALRQGLVVNHSEKGELLEFLRVIVRWTTLRTREDRDGATSQR